MRKAQNVVKFGLKFGAFAALAAALSSCVIIGITPNDDISNVRAQSTYCTPTGGGKTNLDFEFNVNNGITVSQVEVAFLLPPPDNFLGENPVLDSEITDPLKSPNSYLLVSTTIIGTLTKTIGERTIRAAAALEVVPDGNFGSTPTVLNPIKAQGVNAPDGRDGRVWVRGITASGFKTAWAKAAAFTQANVNPASCDPGL
jgi:hypothetical protein